MITPQETSQLTSLLSKLKPGLLPIDVFDQVARLVRLPIVIVTPVKQEGENLFIGLTQREENDPW